MTVRVGINGFGRIGRNFFRAAKASGADVDFVAVNDLGSLDIMAGLLQRDSVHGRYPGTVTVTDDGLDVDGDTLKVLSTRNPADLPWGDLGVDIVVETAGATLDKSLASLAFGGFIGVVGFVAGYEAKIPLRAVLGPMIRIQGIAVGSRARFEAMNRAIALHGLKPVIDSTFPLARGADAFRHLASGQHFGKVVIDVAGA